MHVLIIPAIIKFACKEKYHPNPQILIRDVNFLNQITIELYGCYDIPINLHRHGIWNTVPTRLTKHTGTLQLNIN